MGWAGEMSGEERASPAFPSEDVLRNIGSDVDYLGSAVAALLQDMNKTFSQQATVTNQQIEVMKEAIETLAGQVGSSISSMENILTLSERMVTEFQRMNDVIQQVKQLKAMLIELDKAIP